MAVLLSNADLITDSSAENWFVLVFDCVCNLLMDFGPEIRRALVLCVRPYRGYGFVGELLNFSLASCKSFPTSSRVRDPTKTTGASHPHLFQAFRIFCVEGEDRGAVGILAARQPREKREGGGVEGLCRCLAERHHERRDAGPRNANCPIGSGRGPSSVHSVALTRLPSPSKIRCTLPLFSNVNLLPSGSTTVWRSSQSSGPSGGLNSETIRLRSRLNTRCSASEPSAR